MSTPRSGPLPPALMTLRTAFGGADVPNEVCLVMEKVLNACSAQGDPDAKPLVVLNRSFGQLRRQHPTIFHDLASWLALPETRNTAIETGNYWAWAEWCRAADKLMAGAMASKAFGADKPGRPKTPGFSIYDDAAIIAEERAKYVRSATAETSALANTATLDQRNIQKKRAALRSSGASCADVSEQAEVVRIKHPRG